MGGSIHGILGPSVRDSATSLANPTTQQHVCKFQFLKKIQCLHMTQSYTKVLLSSSAQKHTQFTKYICTSIIIGYSTASSK